MLLAITDRARHKDERERGALFWAVVDLVVPRRIWFLLPDCPQAWKLKEAGIPASLLEDCYSELPRLRGFIWPKIAPPWPAPCSVIGAYMTCRHHSLYKIEDDDEDFFRR